MTSKLPFIGANFLLQSDVAETLYHQYAKELPIIDYHNHLSPQHIAEDQPIKNITEAWLYGDHYKWRAMRANGIEEAFITGNETSPKEKFVKWAETVPYTLRNPLFHWTHLELKRYFNIDELLQPSTAKTIYEKANASLEHKTPAQLLEQMKVEVICTTDDPTDTLEHHKTIAKKGFFTKVLPTFRPDNLILIEAEGFVPYIEKLASRVKFSITNLSELLEAIQNRVDFFDALGCRLSDYGLEQIYAFDFTKDVADAIFQKRLSQTEITKDEANIFASCILFELCKMYHTKGWVQQFHLGALRNNNSRLLAQVGLDAGVDSIGDFSQAQAMSKLFNQLDAENSLSKTITYNLNPSQNEVFATMMGNYSEAGIPGKMQWGSGWWFLDQKDGMEKQLNTLSNMGLLSRFVGMLTDSRSFLSFPRHEYFRRILCNLIAEDLKNGLVPNDIEFLGKMIQDICYNNAVNYFNFEN
ncbi:glucuronate isomerase [Winogradskyella psychrotolerans]|uniref:glucuronate isomerase n=1 Tax=Winogradskyella psychrotolerans TaxID=1344585 RepID=UPI001C068645|nr:glucuronate isomerase [Winogradskyella psychrotolerans]MBU2926676.1 glucuronate isomerase [Winogradskyella psychrotolerans]